MWWDVKLELLVQCMPRPTLTYHSGLCLFFLLANLPRLVAQQPVSTEASLSSEIDTNWKAVQIRVKDLSPEARVAAVGQWLKTQQPKLEELKQKRIQSVRQASAQTVPAPLPAPTPLTELDRINAAIEKEFQSIRNTILSPEERIRLVNAAKEKTACLQAQRAVILRRAAGSTNATMSPAGQVSSAQSTPEGQLAAKTREMLEQIKTMPPKERIASIDARKAEIDSISHEVEVARKAASTSPIPEPQKSPNQENIP